MKKAMIYGVNDSLDSSDNYIFQVNNSDETKLSPFIDRYTHFLSQAGNSIHKNILPATNISMIFNFRQAQINEQKCPDVVVIGLHENVHIMKPLQQDIDTVIVHFSSAGFARFTREPISSLTGLWMDAVEIFGESIKALFDDLKSVHNIKDRQFMLDQFFISKLMDPHYQYPYLAKLSKAFRGDPEYVLSNTKLSYRHLARLFKANIGVNMQTFRRLSHFETAKELMSKQSNISLTDIGYQSGYYDPAHFAREFKKMSGRSARNFGPLCPM